MKTFIIEYKPPMGRRGYLLVKADGHADAESKAAKILAEELPEDTDFHIHEFIAPYEFLE